MSTLTSHLSRGARRTLRRRLAVSLLVAAALAGSCAESRRERRPRQAPPRRSSRDLSTTPPRTGLERAAYLLLPGLVRAARQPAAPARDLAARSRRDRAAPTSTSSATSPASAASRSSAPTGWAAGSTASRTATQARSTTSRSCRTPRVRALPVAADRQLAHLRARKQHGRPGDGAARRAASAPARRSRAMDSVTNLARRYRQMADLPCGATCRSASPLPPGRQLQ